MKVTRFDAVLTYALAALGLWLSYTALADLASRAGLGAHEAAAWPLVVDGLILAATRAVVTFGGHDARRYAWVLLGCAASASIVGNVAHAPSDPSDAGDAPVEDVRQRVLDLLAEGGMSGRAIGQLVGVSEATVRRYRDKAAAEARELPAA